MNLSALGYCFSSPASFNRFLQRTQGVLRKIFTFVFLLITVAASRFSFFLRHVDLCNMYSRFDLHNLHNENTIRRNNPNKALFDMKLTTRPATRLRDTPQVAQLFQPAVYPHRTNHSRSCTYVAARPQGDLSFVAHAMTTGDDTHFRGSVFVRRG